MITFGADVTNPAGEHVRMAFNAQSETIARDYIEQCGFMLKHLYELRRPTVTSAQAPRKPVSFRAIPPDRKRISVNIEKYGIEITIPILRTNLIESSDVIDDFWGFPLSVTIGGGVFIVATIFDVVEGYIPWWWLLALCGWSVLEMLIVWTILLCKFGTEKIRISRKGVTLGTCIGKLGALKTYPLPSLEKLRWTTYSSRANRLVLAIHGREIPVARYITDDNAHLVEGYLRDMLRAGCHTVTNVVFGNVSSIPNPSTIVVNPEVAALQYPFLCLKQLVIDAETYDVYQFDQFLTYAVNAIGAEALRAHVDAHIYGQSAKLHPNHRNNLTHLCRQVIFHDAAYGEHAPDATTVV